MITVTSGRICFDQILYTAVLLSLYNLTLFKTIDFEELTSAERQECNYHFVWLFLHVFVDFLSQSFRSTLFYP